MNIPYVNKIKLLWKISPPLSFPGITSPAPQTRGAVVAVEGADKALVAEVGDFINEYLHRDSSCVVKIWSSPDKSVTSVASADTEMANTRTSRSSPNTRQDDTSQDPFVDYLSIVSGWHKKSREITKFISSTPSSPNEPAAPSSNPKPKSKTLPVALIPRGFSLSISDEFASRIPIADSYAPVDHWQWMATLWRGIIGPDLTIYSKRVNKDELERLGGVEMRSDCKGIVVRVLEAGKMEEKTARRLGFEVTESVRSVVAAYDARYKGEM